MVDGEQQIVARPLKLRDLDAIMAIEPRAYGSHHWSRQSFISELTNPAGCYFGAECRSTGRLLGYTGYWLIGDEAHITTLAVHPEFRRRKIGERLLINNVLQARLEGANWLTLEVRFSNEGAKQLYFKYGFRNLGVRKRYYQDNSEDALVLWTDRISDAGFIETFVNRVAELGLDACMAREVLSHKREQGNTDDICLNSLATSRSGVA